MKAKSEDSKLPFRLQPVIDYYYYNMINVKLCLNLLLTDTCYVGNNLGGLLERVLILRFKLHLMTNQIHWHSRVVLKEWANN